MLTTPTHHHRRLRAGAVLTAFGLGLPVGMAPALAETLAGQAQVSVQASATPDAGTADSGDEAGLIGAADVQADVSVNGYLIGLLDGSGDGPDWSGIADTSVLTDVAADAAATGAPALEVAGGLPADVLGIVLPGLGLPGAGLPGLGLPSLPNRLPSLVLPSVLNSAPTGQDDDPAMVDAGHVGPVGGLVNGSGGNPGDGPASGSNAGPGNLSSAGPSQSVGDSPGSLPRTGANLRLRALAAFGLLGLAGLGSRRRRSA
ncbi:MAG TPA: hypothetical protein VJS45_11855 [Acidimicrobiia bacterium]|nr:hypothetical protein [Acidimicrobiia bacterium]